MIYLNQTDYDSYEQAVQALGYASLRAFFGQDVAVSESVPSGKAMVGDLRTVRELVDQMRSRPQYTFGGAQIIPCTHPVLSSSTSQGWSSMQVISPNDPDDPMPGVLSIVR